LLDEPTNHLDRDGIAFLQSVVKKFHGPVVIVSHDRQFLQDVCTDIFDLRRGTIAAAIHDDSSYGGKIRSKEKRFERLFVDGAVEKVPEEQKMQMSMDVA